MTTPRNMFAGLPRICRGCNCDDNRACVDAHGKSCALVLLDIDTPTGICSACAIELAWDPQALALVGRDPDGTPSVLRPQLLRA